MKIGVFLVVILFFFSCSSSKKVEFDSKSGKVNSYKVGQKFHIGLPENHASGYMWILNYNFNGNVVHYFNSIYHSSNGGYVDFNFQAHSKGTTNIELKLVKYKDTADVKTFIIEVE
jgi:predicted secreted protein